MSQDIAVPRPTARTWLVTGGAGFIGSHLCELLANRGDRLIVLDDLSTGQQANICRLLRQPSVRFVEGSATDAVLVDELMAEADGCLHLASSVGVKLVVSNPLDALLNNVRGAD